MCDERLKSSQYILYIKFQFFPKLLNSDINYVVSDINYVVSKEKQVNLEEGGLDPGEIDLRWAGAGGSNVDMFSIAENYLL